jgi:hypothetical protein
MQFNKITKKNLRGATTPTFSFPVGTDHLYMKEQSKVLWSEVRRGASRHMLIPPAPNRVRLLTFSAGYPLSIFTLYKCTNSGTLFLANP